MNVNAKPLSELRRLEQYLTAASTPFTCAPQQLITSGEWNEPCTIVLQTGVIDGAENNWPSYESTRHFEVAKNYMLDEHNRVPEPMIISKKTMDKLSADDQKVIRAAAIEAGKVERQLENILIPGEQVELAYVLVRDLIVFTEKRLIWNQKMCLH